MKVALGRKARPERTTVWRGEPAAQIPYLVIVVKVAIALTVLATARRRQQIRKV